MGVFRNYLRKFWGILTLVIVEPVFILSVFSTSFRDTASRVLMYDKVCVMLFHQVDECVSRNLTSAQSTDVQKIASQWNFYCYIAISLPQILLSFVYSNLVDGWSKKYTMLFFPVGCSIGVALFIPCAIYLESSPAYLLIGYLVIGLSGESLALSAAVYSYLSATCSESILIIRLSILHALVLATYAAAAAGVGAMIDATGYIVVLSATIGINVLLALYVLLRIKDIPTSPPTSSVETVKEPAEQIPMPVLEDSLQESQQAMNKGKLTNVDLKVFENDLTSKGQNLTDTEQASSLELQKSKVRYRDQCNSLSRDADLSSECGQDDANGDAPGDSFCCCTQLFSSLKGYAKSYFDTVAKKRDDKGRMKIVLILVILMFEAFSCYPIEIGLRYLFLIQPPLSFSTSMYGYHSAFKMGMKAICLVICIPLFKKLAVPYAVMAVLCIISAIIGYTVFALSMYTWMAFLAVVLSVLQGGMLVVARSYIVTFVEEKEYGKINGVFISVELSTMILSSVVFDYAIYPATVAIFHGLSFLICSALLFIPLALAVWLHVLTRKMECLQVISDTTVT